MKNVLKRLAIFSLLTLTGLFASMKYSELLYIPWGENEDQVRNVSYPGSHNGPLSFQVQADKIIIFDTENNKLKSYVNSKIVDSEELPNDHVLDFYRDGEKLYLLQTQKIFVKENNTMQLVSRLDDPKDMYYGFRMQNGVLQSEYRGGKEYAITPILNKKNHVDVRVSRTLPSTLNLQIANTKYSIFVNDIGSVEYLGNTPQGNHYVYVESIINHVPLHVQRAIYLCSNTGKVLQRLTLPQEKFTYVYKECMIGEQGELYHMQSSKDGIHIIRWEYQEDAIMDNFYPQQYAGNYHFNAFVEKEPASEIIPSLEKSTVTSIHRSDVLETADEYVQHIWTATSANIGSTSIVTTPTWIQIGQNQKIPYQWGGVSTVDNFDAGIAAGKLAGDMNTSAGVDLNAAVGADCSGFVCVCWHTDTRYTTRSFENDNPILDSFNDLLPADATNNAGSHIRLVVEWTDDGKLIQIEETGSGWAARYYTWRLSDLTAYKPIRYKNIQEPTLAPAEATLLSVVSSQDSVTITWDADETEAFTGYKIFRKTKEQTGFLKFGETPYGVKSIRLPQGQQIHYDYYVASYNASDPYNYIASDTYAAKSLSNEKQILFVDGFDRRASYIYAQHDFVSQTADAISVWDLNYDACSNEAVSSGDIDLNAYEMVWWICGDESTIDETFDSLEQAKITSYLCQGGKLFVSGSEIAWDLDYKGSANDKAFIQNYLKANYVEDDAANYSVGGIETTAFEALSFNFSENGIESDTYAEDYPDVISPNAGSFAILQYGNNKTAAIAFTGVFTSGSESGKVIYMGFPFEVISTADERHELAGYILRYMGYDVENGITSYIPVSATLDQNYPNPFNPTTSIRYTLTQGANVAMRIFNIKGEMIQSYALGHKEAGEHKMIFDGTSLSSGMYVYRLDINNMAVDAGKMILNK